MDEQDAATGAEIQERWDVFDGDGERVGEVAEVRRTSFVLESSVGTPLEISFTDVQSAEEGRVTLTVSGDELTSNLGSPPEP